MTALTYQFFAVLAGWLEAVLYARRGAESFHSDEHVGMLFQRISVVLVAVAAVVEYHWLGPWLALEIGPAALLFPLIHDEGYNFTRLWLTWAEYHQKSDALALASGRPSPEASSDRRAWREAWAEYRYGYQSPTTTARFDFTGRQRTWLAVAGLLGLVALYLFFRLR